MTKVIVFEEAGKEYWIKKVNFLCGKAVSYTHLGLSVRTVKFICRVFIPVGEDIETVENYVGFRI